MNDTPTPTASDKMLAEIGLLQRNADRLLDLYRTVDDEATELWSAGKESAEITERAKHLHREWVQAERAAIEMRRDWLDQVKREECNRDR